MSTEVEFPCPSCGFLVFAESIGSYDICPVCDWEDDPVQLRFPTMAGGANGGSLAEYQSQILVEIPVTVREQDGFRRAADWRPLEAGDCDSTGALGSGIAYFVAAADENPPYYWRGD